MINDLLVNQSFIYFTINRFGLFIFLYIMKLFLLNIIVFYLEIEPKQQSYWYNATTIFTVPNNYATAIDFDSRQYFSIHSILWLLFLLVLWLPNNFLLTGNCSHLYKLFSHLYQFSVRISSECSVILLIPSFFWFDFYWQRQSKRVLHNTIFYASNNDIDF